MQARFLSNIGESAVTIVLIQAVRALTGTVKSRAAKDEDIQPAVVIVVQERGSTAGCLQNVRFVIFRPKNNWRSQAGSLRDIGEMREKRDSRGLSPWRRRYVPGRYPLSVRCQSWNGQ
jgi:hypothetical protein